MKKFIFGEEQKKREKSQRVSGVSWLFFSLVIMGFQAGCSDGGSPKTVTTDEAPTLSECSQELLGDINEDGFVDDVDLGILFGSLKAEADLNDDGFVNAIDVNILLANFEEEPSDEIRGDLNGDGSIDDVDVGILLANFGGTEEYVEDINDDGFVDDVDLGILLAHLEDEAQGDLNGDGVTDSEDLQIFLSDDQPSCD